MNLFFKITILTLAIFIIGCANSNNNKTDFSRLIESQDDWVSHSTSATGEIEIIYNERLKVKLDLDKNLSLDRYVEIFEETKPSYFCHHKYNFNKSKELVSVTILFETCQFNLL